MKTILISLVCAVTTITLIGCDDSEQLRSAKRDIAMADESIELFRQQVATLKKQVEKLTDENKELADKNQILLKETKAVRQERETAKKEISRLRNLPEVKFQELLKPKRGDYYVGLSYLGSLRNALQKNSIGRPLTLSERIVVRKRIIEVEKTLKEMKIKERERLNKVNKLDASLSKFTIDRRIIQNVQWNEFVFTLNISNQGQYRETFYVVVYGTNNNFSPPRRGAWPLPGFLFGQARTQRGSLSSSDISRNWNSRGEDSKGGKITLEPGESDSIEGALFLNEKSQHGAWRGQKIDSRANYKDINLWVYSSTGKLILEQKYEVK